MKSRLIDIWQSLRAMPLWVQIWMAFILVPVNFAGLLFLNTTYGQIAAILGIMAILPNALVLWLDRGFSKRMAIPHLLPWTVLVAWIVWMLPEIPDPSPLRTFLLVLLVVDLISLGFDYADAFRWWRGERDIVRPASPPE